MRYLFNDASFHGQFSTSDQFLASLGQVMGIRNLLAGRHISLEVLRSILDRPVVRAQLFRTVLGHAADKNQTRQVLLWLDRDGPFWEEQRRHPPPEYFECNNELVTDTALGEACFLEFEQQNAFLVSATPSSHTADRVAVVWRARPNKEPDFTARIQNFTSIGPLRTFLDENQAPPQSWKELLERIAADCPSLHLSPDISSQLGVTFYPQVANMAMRLFSILERINAAAIARDWDLVNQLRADWMSGNNAYFSDSSESEKNDFGDDMTFGHPDTGEGCFCPWHGKINHQVYRIHFEWPKPDGRVRLFVGYFGPKITRR